jgi:hypothetical protein
MDDGTSRPKRLVRLGFSKGEWEDLEQQSLFRAAAQSAKSLEDVANVIRFGKKLIASGKSQPPQGR